MFSEKIFKSLAENSPDITAILDSELTYLYINPAITKYTGLQPEDITGKDIHFVYRSEENVRLMLWQIKRCIETKSSSEIDLRVNTREGLKFFNVKISAAFGANGQVCNIFLISRDITDIKHHEEELEKKDEYISTSTEALLQPFAILSPVSGLQEELIDFKYEHVNKAAENSNGITREEMLSRTMLELFPLHRNNGVFVNLKKVYETGNSWRDTVYYNGPAGGNLLEGVFEISAAKVQNGLVVTWNDVTNLKVAEERLRKSEKKFNLAFEGSPAAMILSKNDGEIVDVNKACETMFGFSREILLGRKSIDIGFFVDPRDRDLLVKILKKDGVIKNLEFELRNRSKEVINSLLSVVQIEIENEPHLLSVLVDITDQRRLENSLQDTLREKVVLLQEVHHRVRNNMQIIISMMNLQRNSITDHLLNDQLLAAQNRIRSMALVYDKLFPADSYTNINLKNYLSALISESSDTLFSPEVHFEFNVPEEFSVDIESAIKIGLIVNELFTNSFKHAFSEASQGKIEIKINLEKENLLHLNYLDNGKGLPETLDIYEPVSLGFKLINILVDDLNGKLEYHHNNGCSIFDMYLKIRQY